MNESVQTNPCNSCAHRSCCKYVDDIQKVVKEMNIVRQIRFDDRVFELSTVVNFKCDMYSKRYKPDKTVRTLEKED